MKKLFLPVIVSLLSLVCSCDKGENPITKIPGGELKSSALILVPSSNKVNIFDVITNRNNGSLETDAMPSAIAISPDNRMVLVTNYNSGTVSVFLRRDNTTFSKLNSIGNGKNPDGVIFNPDKNISEAYVTYSGDNKMIVLDTSNKNAAPKVLKTINFIDSSPDKIIATNDGSKLFISDAKNSRIIIVTRVGNNFVINYSESFKTATENIRMEGIIIDQKNRVFIAESSNNQIIVFDINTNKMLTKISLKDSTITDSVGPKNMVIYNDKKTNQEKIYITGFDASVISVVDGDKLNLIKNIHLDSFADKPSYNPVGISIGVTGTKQEMIYVTNSSGRSISIIDPETDLLKENTSDVGSLAQQRPLDQILTIGPVS